LPRVDDFLNAIALAKEALPSLDPVAMSRNAGAELVPLADGKKLILRFLNKPVEITYPEGLVEYAGGAEKLSPQEKGLILHYLLGARDIPPAGELITFREIPSGEFYYEPFLKRAQTPLLATFGAEHGLFRQAGETLGGRDAGLGDVSLTLRPLPRIPLTFVLWNGDEEFDPTASILFDANIKCFLGGEDIAFLAGTVVYKLMALARR